LIAWEAAKSALENVFEAVSGESVLIVCDDEKVEVGEAFTKGSLALGLWTRIIVLQTTRKPRAEVPKRLLEVFTEQKPNLYVNLMRGIVRRRLFE
jgi:hypothetical protein